MVTVWLIRHGESEANAGLVTADPIGIQLTAKGHEQAKSLVQLFSDAPSLIVTSRFLRTRQTAQLLIDKFTRTPQAEWPIEELTYLSPVRFKDTAVDERRPAAQKYWQLSDPFYVDGEGAESFSDFMRRVYDFCQRITALPDNFIAVFTHEKFIQAVLWRLLTNPAEINSKAMTAYRHFTDSFSVPNGALTQLNITGKDVYFSNIMTSHLPRL